MKRKGSNTTLPKMSLLGVIGILCVFIAPTAYAEGDSATCQCGVFLLGAGTLTFSSDAKPVLAGLPVAANCSASDDKISCATICRQLIQAMSGNQENTPLVQTVVLAATRTLACQRFNESHKVPAPRNFEGTNRQTLAQLDEQNKWKFFVGQSSHGARSDLAAERVGTTSQNGAIDGSNNNADQEEEATGALTDPKWLGGYYRWCDEHWIYAGVSLHEPLCCQGHVPKRCPNYHPEEATTRQASARNGRRPRLIVIKRCPNNVCEDEDDEEADPSSGESNSNKVSPTSLTKPSLDDGEDETEAPEAAEKDDEVEDETQKDTENDESSSETINLYTTPTPIPAKPLNATVMSEALKFFETLMEGLGYGEIFEGVRSVLPETTTVQLLERINHGGWLTHYQDRYIKWPREFSLGYCYMEYSMYNVKSEGGLVPATQSLLERMFGPDRPLPPGARLPQPPQTPQAPVIQNPYDAGLAGELTNYIQPIPQIPGNSFGGYDQYEQQHSRIPGNRRVRRGVSVSRSYSGSPAARVTGRSNTSRAVRRNSVRRVKPQSRNVPIISPYEVNPVPVPQVTAAPVPVATPPHSYNNQFVPIQTIQPTHNSGSVGGSRQQSSFVPTNTEKNSNGYQPNNDRQSANRIVYRNNVPYVFDSYQQTTPVRRSHLEGSSSSSSNNNQNLAEIARPRRHPGPGGEEIVDDDATSPSAPAYQTTGSQRGPMGPQQMPQHHQQQQRPPNPTGKDGPSAGNLLNIANMLMQTAMASGGNNEGDKVTNMMQTAIPLVAQVANNPAVHSMVNNLVTTFLTPPNANAPPPPPPPRPSRPEPEDNNNWGSSGSSNNKRPHSSKNPIRDSEEFSSNEIDEPEVTSSNQKPVNARPPPNGGGGGGGGGGGATEMIASMVQNMVSSYIKHLFSPGPGRPPRPNQRPGPSNNNSPNDKLGADKPAINDQVESNDIVDVIANAAKPFFISTFGVVPGDPGYGRLLNRRRDGDLWGHGGGTSKRHNPNDILTEDPDPGTGLFDIIVGPPNFPDTGNKMYDFGNRVVYGFKNANEPHHGVYCFKQYFVNKVWDYFRMGIKTVFK